MGDVMKPAQIASFEPAMRDNLLTLARAYAKARGIKLSTLSRFAHGDPPFFDKLGKAKAVGFTVRKYDQAMQWFRNNWPDDLPWPDIWNPPRPSRKR